MTKQKKFLLFAIMIGLGGVIVGGIIFVNTIMNLLH